MRTWLGRALPLIVWASYLFAFPWLSEHLGQYARMIGLVPVAVFGWTWGVFSGAVGGILGLLAIEFWSGNLAPGEWLVTYTFPSERVFELLTFTGTGLAVAFLHRFRRTIIVE